MNVEPRTGPIRLPGLRNLTGVSGWPWNGSGMVGTTSDDQRHEGQTVIERGSFLMTPSRFPDISWR
jgi:hypothetical protein